jgi:DNA-binding transcriptional MerR regulator
MSPAAATADPPLRIGDVAKLTGTTARTLRYYEEIGLLPGAEDREAGRHRVYTQAEVDRVREVLRLRDLLGVSLEELRELLAAEEARAALREEFHRTERPAARRRILKAAMRHPELEHEFGGILRAAVDHVPDDLPVTTVHASGPPAQAILREAKRGGHDLIVMGSRGLGFARAILGSVSHRVLTHAPPGAVLIVHAEDEVPDPPDPGPAPGQPERGASVSR